jgi:hypothetical protein
MFDRCFVDTAQHGRIHSVGFIRVVRQPAVLEPAQTRERKPLRPGDHETRAAVPKLPFGAGPGVEQHRGDHQIECRACGDT